MPNYFNSQSKYFEEDNAETLNTKTKQWYLLISFKIGTLLRNKFKRSKLFPSVNKDGCNFVFISG